MNTRRARRWAIAAVVTAAAVPLWSAVAGASTSTTSVVGFTQDGTFWRLQPRAPVVDVPCLPGDPIECGQIAPTSLTGFGAPQVTDGNMVVGSSGGQPGADKGDQFWIVAQPDLGPLGAISDVEKFTLVLTQAADNRGDFGTPVIKACNIVANFGVGEGTNPWDDRPPIDCSGAKAPTVSGATYTFDLTEFAKTWVDGRGHGVAVVPGLVATPAVVTDPAGAAQLPPFQLTVGNSNKVDAARKPAPDRSRASIRYVAGADPFTSAGDTAGSFLGGAGSSLDNGFSGGSGAFGSDSSSVDSGFSGGSGSGAVSPGGPVALATPTRNAVARSAGFAWSLLLLIPLGLFFLWATGSALGPLGDPVAARQGGVARLVARRQAARPVARGPRSKSD